MIPSPYCLNYKIPMKPQDRGLIMQHLLVRKLTRRELEDKYLRLIDENFELKKENHQQKEKIKILTTKLLRVSKENFKYKSRDYLFLDVDNEIQETDELFRSRRAASASLRKDSTRNSTPNLINSRFKSTEDFLHHENTLLDLKTGRASTGATPRTYPDSTQEMSNTRKPEDHPSTSRSRSPELQDEIKRLKDEIDKLQKESELEKRTNSQLEIQIKELKEKINNSLIQKELEENVQVQELNRKIKELQVQYEILEKESKTKLEQTKKEQAELVDQLERERIKVKRVDEQEKDLNSATKMIESLMERITQVEKEKADLITQTDRFASVSDEIASLKAKNLEMREKLMEKEKELENEKSNKESIAHSQENLLQKMKNLQKENDELVVKLEGLRTENEGLLMKNKNLEDRLKDMENQNKEQLEKLIEWQKVPQRVQKELEKIEEIRQLDANSQRRTSTDSNASDTVKKPALPAKDYAPPASPSSTDKSAVESVKTVVNESPIKKPTPNKRRTSEIESSELLNYFDQPQVATAIKTATTTNGTNNSKRYLDSKPTIEEIEKVLSQEQDEIPEEEEEEEDIDQKTYSIEQTATVSNRGAIDRATKILMGQVMSQIPQGDEDIRAEYQIRRSSQKLSWDTNLNKYKFMGSTSESSVHSSVENLNERRSKTSTDDEQWTPSQARRSSRPSMTEENVSNLARFLQRKSLGSVSTLSSNRSSLRSEADFDNDWRNLNFSPDPDLARISYDKSLEVAIEVVCVEMLATDIMMDETIKQLYVEYTFLGYRGHMLETPQSLPKPTSPDEIMKFNYRKTFDLNFKKDNKQLKILKSMLEYNSPLPLRFLLISEPTEYDLENDEDSECEEIGFATVNLHDLVRGSTSNIERLTVMVYATRYCHEPIAHLTIQIEGIKNLKKFITHE